MVNNSISKGEDMKKFLSVLMTMIICLTIGGCSCTKDTAKRAVEDFLNQYKSLSSNVISDMEEVVDKEDLNDEQKEKYRDILKKQYQDLKYEIVNEEYDGDDATVEVKITVYDLYKVQKDANDYLSNNSDEFKDESDNFSNDLFMDYKLDKMQKSNETVEYTIFFKVIKDEDGNYKVTDVTNDDLEKIHGIYNYDNK